MAPPRTRLGARRSSGSQVSLKDLSARGASQRLVDQSYEPEVEEDASESSAEVAGRTSPLYSSATRRGAGANGTLQVNVTEHVPASLDTPSGASSDEFFTPIDDIPLNLPPSGGLRSLSSLHSSLPEEDNPLPSTPHRRTSVLDAFSSTPTRRVSLVSPDERLHRRSVNLLDLTQKSPTPPSRSSVARQTTPNTRSPSVLNVFFPRATVE
ncbi:hypothetical protein BDY21DRAFT_394138 [Lineolata rhizophorae]|uniref:Uncharacterized protein n=1 Tax=Lineolata rhizophorae TaxID=578093 RepID=A0A6A6NZ78_9PEZI|nr:hypothetical protein BDY21DRAFT_394138 [Lineolata rhizophorae]